MVTIKDGCGCDPCDCDWKQKLKEAYSRAIQSVNKIGDETGRVYYPDGTGFVKVPLPTKEQIDSLAQVDAIKASVDELNKTVPSLETQVARATDSLVSDAEVLNGTTAGKFKVRIKREKAAVIDSNDYDLSKVNSIELIQGSGPAMVKAQLTLSDGTVLRSDDFLFNSESIGTDVYISSFTFKAGNVDGTISADIGLNNGTTLEANNFVVPTDPSVVSSITDLQTRMSAVENGSGVNGLDALKATVGTHTTEITQLTNDVGDLTTSKVNVAQGTENAGKALVIGADGNVTVGSAGGAREVWEEVDLNNFPTDWVGGDRIKFIHTLQFAGSATSWTSQPSVSGENPLSNGGKSKEIFEITIPEAGTNNTHSLIWFEGGVSYINLICLKTLYGYSAWNGNYGFMSVEGTVFNGNGAVQKTLTISRNSVSKYFAKMWRLKR